MHVQTSGRACQGHACRSLRPHHKSARQVPCSQKHSTLGAALLTDTQQDVVASEVVILPPGAVDPSLFDADLSATALLSELEAVSAQLSDVLQAPAGARSIDLGSWPDDTSDMMRSENGMYSATAADKLLLREAVNARREAAKAERRQFKAERQQKRDARLRRIARAVVRASRRASESMDPQEVEVEAAATGAVPSGATVNRGGPAGPGPSSAALAAPPVDALAVDALSVGADPVPAPAAAVAESAAAVEATAVVEPAAAAAAQVPLAPVEPVAAVAADAPTTAAAAVNSSGAAAEDASLAAAAAEDAPAAAAVASKAAVRAAAVASKAAVRAAAAPSKTRKAPKPSSSPSTRALRAAAAAIAQQQQQQHQQGKQPPPSPLLLALALPTPRFPSLARSLRRPATRTTSSSPTAAAAALPAAQRGAAAVSKALPADLDGGARSTMAGFFLEASRNELLSAGQEKELYVLVQEHIRIEGAGAELASRLGRTPTDGEWAEAVGAAGVDSFRAARTAAAAAKQLFIKSNMRLVMAVAKRYQGMGLSLSDLVSEGIAGLERGVEKFDATKGFKFSTYAHWWIRQGVTRALTEQGRLVRLPSHMQELLSRVQRTSKQMEGDLRRKPTRAELAAHMNVNEGKLEEMYSYLQNIRSLEGTVGGDADGVTLGETIEDESNLDADESSLMSGLKDDMTKLLATLPEREAVVMRMRYGLDGDVFTLDEIGRSLKVTRERIRQIEAKALRGLRSNMGAMEQSIGEYSGASFQDERLAARTSSGTRKQK